MSRLCLVVAAWALAGACGGVPAQPALQARTIEPRAYGYQVGDVLQRHVLVDVPDDLALDAASLPRPGGCGQALELHGLRGCESFTHARPARQNPPARRCKCSP